MATVRPRSFSIKPNFGSAVLINPHSNFRLGLQNSFNSVLDGSFAKNPDAFYYNLMSVILAERGLGSVSVMPLPDHLKVSFRGQYLSGINSVLLDKDMCANPQQLASMVEVVAHELHHKSQRDGNFYNKMFSSRAGRYISAPINNISKVLGYGNNPKLENVYYHMSRPEHEAFVNGYAFAERYFGQLSNIAHTQNSPMAEVVDKQFEVLKTEKDIRLGVTANLIKDLSREKLPNIYNRSNNAFNKYFDIVKSLNSGKVLTLEQKQAFDEVVTYGLYPSSFSPIAHNEKALVMALALCPIRENVEKLVDLVRDSSSKDTYQIINLISDYNIPITQSDFSKIMLKNDCYKVAFGQRPEFPFSEQFLARVDDKVVIENMLATQGKPATMSYLNFLHKLDAEDKINGVGQMQFNLQLFDEYAREYSNNPIAIINGQPVFGCSQLLDNVFNSYIKENPPASSEERDNIYNQMSDNIVNIMGHFPNFSPSNSQVLGAVNKFISNPLEKQFEDKKELINQTSPVLTPVLANNLTEYVNSQNPDIAQHNAQVIAQNAQIVQSTQTSQNTGASGLYVDGKEITVKELEDTLNNAFNSLAQTINALADVLKSLTEVLNSPKVQEVFAKAGAQVKATEQNPQQVLEELNINSNSGEILEEENQDGQLSDMPPSTLEQCGLVTDDFKQQNNTQPQVVASNQQGLQQASQKAEGQTQVETIAEGVSAVDASTGLPFELS